MAYKPTTALGISFLQQITDRQAQAGMGGAERMAMAMFEASLAALAVLNGPRITCELLDRLAQQFAADVVEQNNGQVKR